MSSTAVYTTASLGHPAQDQFAEHYDLDDPMAAINHYARIMREHTQRQMDTAARSSRRRSEGSMNGVSTAGDRHHHHMSRGPTGSGSS